LCCPDVLLPIQNQDCQLTSVVPVIFKLPVSTMLLFGHLGITLAAAQTFEILSQGKKKFTELIDYRLVLLGSLLPDIIDKPLGGLIFKESLGNGRIYAHTLLFLLLLFGLGMFLWLKLQRPGVLTLAGGSFVHHILDGMWYYPETCFWPAYGGSFPKGDPEGWFKAVGEQSCN